MASVVSGKRIRKVVVPFSPDYSKGKRGEKNGEGSGVLGDDVVFEEDVDANARGERVNGDGEGGVDARFSDDDGVLSDGAGGGEGGGEPTVALGGAKEGVNDGGSGGGDVRKKKDGRGGSGGRVRKEKVVEREVEKSVGKRGGGEKVESREKKVEVEGEDDPVDWRSWGVQSLQAFLC